MKFILKNIFVLLLILLPAVGFSAPTPPSPAPPPPDLPVDQYIFVLIGMALIFAFYSFKKKIAIK